MSYLVRWIVIPVIAVLSGSCGGGGGGATDTVGSSSAPTSTSTGTGSTIGATTGSNTGSTTGSGTVTGTVSSVAVNAVSISPASNTLNSGSSYQLTVSLKDASGATLSGKGVTWVSSNVAVASVSGDGVVSGVSAGSASITASSEGKSASASVVVLDASSGTVVIKVDAAKTEGLARELLGVNRKPSDTAQTGGQAWDGAALYQAFGVSQVRLHDSGIDLCSIFKAATKLNAGVTPQVPVVGCTLTPNGAVPHFIWTPTSSADADLNNPDNYDFTSADEAVLKSISTGAKIYLGLAQNYNGPNDTTDAVAWAKVATNVYKHVIGVFKPTAGIAVNPAYVEVHNEPDGGFWRGSAATFNTLFSEINQRVRAAAAASNKSLKIGGPGFTRNVLSNATKVGNPANGFVASVGASTLDFYSAHLYDTCSTAKLSNSAGFLRSVRGLADSQGAAGKPLHITEWNIGLGSQCGNDFFSEQRTQSYASGILTLMQDPAQNIEAAHFYAGMPIMALFDFSSVSGAVRVNPSSWAFWAHGKLKGSTLIDTQVCPRAGSCVKGYASETASLQAIAGQIGSAQQVIVTNDTNASVTYTIQVSGLTGAMANVVISKPPSGAQDLTVTGNPSMASASSIATLLGSVSTETRAALTVVGGQVQVTVTVPAYSVQAIDVR